MYPNPVTGSIVPDDSVRLRIEIAADDDVDKMEYADLIQMQLIMVPELLDADLPQQAITSAFRKFAK